MNIRNERVHEYRLVEEITREAFWNQYIPGCDEHYLVHLLRDSADFVPELTFVAEIDGRVVGSIFFSKSYIVDTSCIEHETLTFGPVSILPSYQNQGIGSALIKYAIQAAALQKHTAILIYGYPAYYHRFGFKHAKEFGISNPEGKFPFAHLALELRPGALDSICGKAFESSVFEVDQEAAQEFDTLFPPKEKEITPSQKLFEDTAARYI